MTTISQHVSELLFEDEERLAGVTVEIEADAEASERDRDALRAVDRIENAVRHEVQAMQDDLDEDGEVQA